MYMFYVAMNGTVPLASPECVQCVSSSTTVDGLQCSLCHAVPHGCCFDGFLRVFAVVSPCSELRLTKDSTTPL